MLCCCTYSAKGMLGTMLNVSGILIGGTIGLKTAKSLSAAAEAQLKVILGAATAFFGLRLTWLNLTGPFVHGLKQCAVLILALMLGKAIGRLLQLQSLSNRLGRRARDQIQAAQDSTTRNPNDGFYTCVILFCAAPLGLVGAIVEGLSLSHYFYPLGAKAVMEFFAALSLARVLGWGVLLSALPVLAIQGTLSLGCAHFLYPFLTGHGLLESANAAAGLLVFCVALVMLGIKRIELTDYLPSLIFAPVLTWIS